jgi:hypothetical protein
MRFIGFGLAAALALALLQSEPARADTLAPDELSRLIHGDTVARETTVDDGEHRYVGGIAYAFVDAAPAAVEALLDDVTAYRFVLPRTKEAKKVGTDGGDALVELHQGSSVFETSYTIRVRKDDAARTVRFWLDATRPHGIDDAWGFFRWTPTDDGRVLVTFGALVDVGPGIVRMFFEERVRAAMLSVPELVRGYVTREHAVARRDP